MCYRAFGTFIVLLVILFYYMLKNINYNPFCFSSFFSLIEWILKDNIHIVIWFSSCARDFVTFEYQSKETIPLLLLLKERMHSLWKKMARVYCFWVSSFYVISFGLLAKQYGIATEDLRNHPFMLSTCIYYTYYSPNICQALF